MAQRPGAELHAPPMAGYDLVVGEGLGDLVGEICWLGEGAAPSCQDSFGPCGVPRVLGGAQERVLDPWQRRASGEHVMVQGGADRQAAVAHVGEDPDRFDLGQVGHGRGEADVAEQAASQGHSVQAGVLEPVGQ